MFISSVYINITDSRHAVKLSQKGVSLMLKGPQMKIIFNAVPNFSQTMGFKYQKNDNKQSKDDLLEREKKTHGCWKDVDKQAKDRTDYFGDHGHENGTKYGPQDASHAAHNNHCQVSNTFQ